MRFTAEQLLEIADRYTLPENRAVPLQAAAQARQLATLRASVAEWHRDAKAHAEQPETSQNNDVLDGWKAAMSAYADVLRLLDALGTEEKP